MSFGLGVLRLSSHDFWAMTPRELQSAAERIYGRAMTAPSRMGLDALMQSFPDQKEEAHE